MQAAAAASFWLLCVLGTCPLARCGRAGKFAFAGVSRTLWSLEDPLKAAPAFPQCAVVYFLFLFFEGRRGRGVSTHVWGTRGCISNLGSNAFFFFFSLSSCKRRVSFRKTGKGCPVSGPRDALERAGSRAFQLVSLRPSQLGPGGRRRGIR